MTFLRFGLLLCCLFAGTKSSANGQLIWNEEFSTGSVPDSTLWSYDLGNTGWGNQELQNYTDDPANARIEEGNLIISILEQSSSASNQTFSSARIHTQDKLTVKYGTIEARIWMPDLADGLWPAFWTLGNNYSQVGWPFCGELDILELGNAQAITEGVVNRRVGSTAHWENEGQYASYGLHKDMPADLDDGYHLFRMEWTPDLITTYVDDEQIWTIDISSESCADCQEFHKPHFIILNVAVGGTYTGLLFAGQISAPLPAEMKVDYVRIYDNGFTELGGSAIGNRGPAIATEHSGSWYNPEQSGYGFSIEVGERPDGSPLVVVYWYLYDDQGNPIFFTGLGDPVGDTVEVVFDSPVGMKFGEFDPESVTRHPGGTGVFVFTNSGSGYFSYTPSDFSVSTWGHMSIELMPVVKLFSIKNTESNVAVRHR